MRLKITDAPYFVKIPVRLKISGRSENPYLKIPVHQWANRPERMQEHTTTTRPPQESRRATKGEQAGKRQTK